MIGRHSLPCSAFALLLLLAPVPNIRAADGSSSVESVLTADSIGFLHVRIGDVWDSPSMAFYRKMLHSLGADEIKAFDGKFAPKPTQFESLTVVMPTFDLRSPIPDGRPVGESFLWVITTKEPIDRVELVKGLGLEARTKSHRGTAYLFDEAHWAGLILLDSTTLVVGSEDSILRLIERRENSKGKENSLAKIFSQEAGKHTATLALNPVAFATPEVLRDLPEPLTPLVKATTAWAALDMKQETRLLINFDFASAEAAAEGAKALESARGMANGLIALGMKEIESQETAANKRPLMGLLDLRGQFTPILGKAALKYVQATLKGLAIEKKESTVRTSLNLSEFFPANGDALAVMAFAALAEPAGGYFSYGRADDGRGEIPYHLRDQFGRIAAALKAYHDDKGNFPPAALYDKDGKALLSWRVLILPYLEQRPGDLPPPGMRPGEFRAAPPFKKDGPGQPVERTFADLYKQFKLDEPWDSLHNKKLIERMPRVFHVDFSAYNWRQQRDWKTGLQVFTGPGTLFPGREAVSKGQVRDGLDATIAVVLRDDSAAAVPWTKPADIPFAADKRLPKLFAVPPDFRGGQPNTPKGVYVIMADGTPRRVPPDFDEKDFKALVTIAGGESVKLPEPKVKEEPFTKEFRRFDEKK